MDADQHSARHENSLLILLVAAGALLIALEPHLQHLLPHTLVATLGGLGEAFFIAGTLGFIVDRGLKETLAKDALSFLVGWEVTPALREAVKDIIRLPCVRRGLLVHYTIERCETPKGFVRLRSETSFYVENMTGKPQQYDFQSRVEPSAFAEVKAAGLENATLEMGIADAEKAAHRSVLTAPVDKAGVLVRSHPVMLPGHGKQWFRTVRMQYFPDNFFVVLDFLAPASEGASVTLTPNPAFNTRVRFGAEPDTDPEVNAVSGMRRWEYAGVLLPGQHLRLFWSPA